MVTNFHRADCIIQLKLEIWSNILITFRVYLWIHLLKLSDYMIMLKLQIHKMKLVYCS